MFLKEFVNCNLCSKNSTKLLFRISGHNIVKCTNCGLIYINPRLKEKSLHEIYKKEYYRNAEFKNSSTQSLFGYDLYIEEKEDIVNTFKRRLRVIEKYKKHGKLLDIGCATGFFLELAESRGWGAYGTDVSKFASEYAKRKLGLKNIFYGDLSKAKFKDEMFDAVTIFDVIEHLPDPKGTLKEINRILKNDGLIVVTTPNSGSLAAKILGKKWEEFRRAREHIYFFSADTLSNMLEKNGFEVLKIESAGRYFSFKSAARRGKLYFKKIFAVLGFIVGVLGIENKKIYINPHYKITVYARKNEKCIK